jgi:hypothetical protein
LQVCAQYGHVECARLLINRGADINKKNKKGNTALIVTSGNNHRNCINLLLDCGANVDSANYVGNTALHISSGSNHPECIHLLLERHADIHYKDIDGHTALHLASGEGHGECVRVLLEKGADIHCKDKYGNTSLYSAAGGCHVECIEILLDNGDDINNRDLNGHSALDIAVRRSHLAAIQVLLERGSDIDEGMINRVADSNCKRVLLNGIQNRRRRNAYDSFINDHLLSYKNQLTSKCFSSGKLQVTPSIGWSKAYMVRDKYYFDEIFYYIHMNIAADCTRSIKNINRKAKIAISECKDNFVNNNNRTFTLMNILTDRIKEYLKTSLCFHCNQTGNKKCSRCQCTIYCSSVCQKADWISHKLLCKVSSKV